MEVLPRGTRPSPHPYPSPQTTPGLPRGSEMLRHLVLTPWETTSLDLPTTLSAGKKVCLAKSKNGSKWHQDFYETLGTSNQRLVSGTLFLLLGSWDLPGGLLRGTGNTAGYDGQPGPSSLLSLPGRSTCSPGTPGTVPLSHPRGCNQEPWLQADFPHKKPKQTMRSG